MFLEIIRAYPWAFLSTVILPFLVTIGAVFVAAVSELGGFETLQGRFAASQAASQHSRQLRGDHIGVTALLQTSSL
jgi:hypothetical protein